MAKAKPTTSVFSAAPVIVTAKPKRGNTTPEKAIAGLNDRTALDTVIAALLALKQDADLRVKEHMRREFMSEGIALGRRPENFSGVEGFAKASCQLRTSSSALTPDEINFCKEHGLTIDEETIAEETLIFNAAYVNDPKFIQRMETDFGKEFAALQDERGPLIMKQQGSKKSHVSEAAMDHLFTLKNQDVIREAMEITFTLAVTARLDTQGDLKPAIERVEELLGASLNAAILKEAATNPAGLAKRTQEAAKAAPRATKKAA